MIQQMLAIWSLVPLPSLIKNLKKGFLCASAGKKSICNVGDLDSIPGLGRSPGEGNSYPLQYPGLENSMDCIVHGVSKSQTRLWASLTSVGIITSLKKIFPYQWSISNNSLSHSPFSSVSKERLCLQLCFKLRWGSFKHVRPLVCEWKWWMSYPDLSPKPLLQPSMVSFPYLPAGYRDFIWRYQGSRAAIGNFVFPEKSRE